MEQIKQYQNLSHEKVNDVITNCDAIVFGSYREDSNNHTIMTFMQSKHGHKATPYECGHKFNIILFDRLCPKEEEVELFSAILGDPKGYVERMGKAGYHGIVVKEKACRSKQIKDVFSSVLFNYGFEAKLIKKVIKATVV